jgi:transposase InsO family protein
MFHSDQRTQYSSKAFIDYCNQNNIAQSMSRKGNCWDNAVMDNNSNNINKTNNHLSPQLIQQKKNIMSEKTEQAIKNRQSRKTGNIGHTRHQTKTSTANNTNG